MRIQTLLFHLMRDMKRGQSLTPQGCRFDSGARPRYRQGCLIGIVILVTSSKAKATSVIQGNVNNLHKQPTPQFKHQHKATHPIKVSRTNNGTPARTLHPLDNPLIDRLLKALHSLQHHPPPPPPHLRRAKTLLRLRLPPPIPHFRRLLSPSRRPPRKILVQIHRLLAGAHRRATARLRSIPSRHRREP